MSGGHALKQGWGPDTSSFSNPLFLDCVWDSKVSQVVPRSIVPGWLDRRAGATLSLAQSIRYCLPYGTTMLKGSANLNKPI